jgi:homeobox-leucine zipper protein
MQWCTSFLLWTLMFHFYLQLYAPTTLVPARDFWTLRYTTIVEDGSLVVRMTTSTKFYLFNSIKYELGYHSLLSAKEYEPWYHLSLISSITKVCERSLSGSGGGPSAASAQQFVRAEMLPSGYLVRPCEGGGSIVHIVDHLEFEVWPLLSIHMFVDVGLFLSDIH